MNLFNLSMLFFAFSTFLLGLLVFLKRQDEAGRKWFVFSLSVTVWSLSYSLWAVEEIDISTAQMWMKMCYVGAVFIPPTWADFVFSFLGRNKYSQRGLRIIQIVSFAITPLILTPYFIGPPRLFDYGFKFYTTPAVTYYIFPTLFFITVIYTFIYSLSVMKRTQDDRRAQVRYFILSTGIGFLGGSLTFLPVFKIDFPQYNLLIMPLYPFIMAYTMMRHGFLDLEEMATAIQRDKLATIGVLAASINHEIRSPLFVARGYAEVLLARMKNNDPEASKNGGEGEQDPKQLLEKSILQMTRAADIAQRLTDFSKPAEEIGPSEFPFLSEIVDNILNFVGYGLERDRVKIEQAIPVDIKIRANQKEMEQVFLNLIMNACQAMRGKGGVIKMEAALKEENGKTKHGTWVEMKISDTGPGIPKENIRRIFEPFFTTKPSGTGLGLYVTKQLVKKNGGTITIQTKIGEGTCFLLRFPAVSQVDHRKNAS